ncbi:hypothetical protein FisN_3Lh059 [Fistulifera solaris]|uniref:RanBD1 domain-containing protein n=1 Tax=Fistulifera solaris TaxID=1519565 RepID=A0A1Z5JYX8_FISSO|nr:hypothetical protein FisN_3Lh059 [Fistulifera solaris]|eukprot:GAX19119.1 hypothetical protein FisN_3Lh059 [Fistulifera solaris]
MSSKRAADRQITKDDTEQDNDNDNNSDQEVTFGITKASAEQLNARRIVRVRRPALSSVQENGADESKSAKEDDTEKESKSSNPFASIQLTLSGGTSTSVFGAATGFRSFGSLSSNEKDVSGPSIFGASSGFQGFGSVASANGFGSAKDTSSTAPATFGGFASLSSSTPSSSFTFGTIKGNDATVTAKSLTATEDNDDNVPTLDTSLNNTPSNPVVTLPDEYVLESGEEEYKLELEVRCKSYRWMKKALVTETQQETSAPSVPSTELFTKSNTEKGSTEENDGNDVNKHEDEGTTGSKEQHTWVEQGVGPVRLLQIPNATNRFARLTQRRQAEEGGKPTKVLINLLIGRESTADPHTDKVVRVSSVEFSDEGTKPVLYLFRFKDGELMTTFLGCLKKVIPQAKSFQQTDSADSGLEETGDKTKQ